MITHSNQIRLFWAILEHCAITEFKMGEIARAIQNDERILRKQWYQNIFRDFSGFPTGSSSPPIHKKISPFFFSLLPFISFLSFVSVETQDLIQVRGDVIELQVLNGTHWLNLGGNVETFEAVIAVPPETSSQVTLLQALTKLNQVRKCISTTPEKKVKLLLCCIFHACFFFFALQTSDPAGNIKALIQFQPKTLSSSYLHILQQFSQVKTKKSQSPRIGVLN